MSGFAKFSPESGLCGEFGVFSAVGLLVVGVANSPSPGDHVGHPKQRSFVLQRLMMCSIKFQKFKLSLTMWSLTGQPGCRKSREQFF